MSVLSYLTVGSGFWVNMWFLQVLFFLHPPFLSARDCVDMPAPTASLQRSYCRTLQPNPLPLILNPGPPPKIINTSGSFYHYRVFFYLGSPYYRI